jgi:AraC-like DNA-binding protein
MTLAIITYGGAHALLLATGFLVGKGRDARIPAALFFCVAIAHWNEAAESSGVYLAHPHLSNVAFPFLPLIGPLLNLYFTRITDPGAPARRRDYAALLAAPISALLLVPFYILTAEAKVAYNLRQLQEYNLLPLYHYLSVVFILFYGYMIAFLIPAAKKVSFVWSRDTLRGARVNLYTLAFILWTILILVVFILGRILASEDINDVGWCLSTALLIGLYLVGQRHPAFLERVRQQAEKARYEKSRLRGLDTGDVIARMERLFQQEQIYADEDLSLGRVAEHLSIHTHQLSQILNERLNTSFKNYVNAHRIRAACHMLAEEPERSILSVAFAVGFNSKSNFNRVFGETQGCSPTEYRGQALGG